jgi:hypothetical protein
MSPVKKPFIGLAAFLVGTYLVLSVFSIACAFEHDQPQPSGHHHGSTVSHSSYCAWACQVNPTSDAGPSALVLHPLLVVAPFVESGHAVLVNGHSFHAASRAPPVRS